VPIDTLSFEFSVINLDEREILAPPKEGVYVKGLFLEGEPQCAWHRAVQNAFTRPALVRAACEEGRALHGSQRKEAASPQPCSRPFAHLCPLRLVGAGWDFENGCLCEPNPMELIVPMPILLFRPVENKKRTAKGIYSCPLYLYPVRTGTRERPSFMINVDLRSGTSDPDHWVMRGTALLLSLAT
jgi:hypothetical protein